MPYRVLVCDIDTVPDRIRFSCRLPITTASARQRQVGLLVVNRLGNYLGQPATRPAVTRPVIVATVARRRRSWKDVKLTPGRKPAYYWIDGESPGGTRPPNVHVLG